MKLEFGFGKGIQTVELPEDNLMGVLTANTVEYDLTGEDEVSGLWRSLLARLNWRML